MPTEKYVCRAPGTLNYERTGPPDFWTKVDELEKEVRALREYCHGLEAFFQRHIRVMEEGQPASITPLVETRYSHLYPNQEQYNQTVMSPHQYYRTVENPDGTLRNERVVMPVRLVTRGSW